MSYVGDYAAGDTVDFKFTTRRFSTGAPFQLGGTPAISVYKSNSTTQSTSGVTLTVDFGTVTGMNHVRIDTSSDGTFYANGSQFDVVITTGTVDSVSVVGEVVGRFTLRAQASLYPTTAGRTLDVTATGAAGIDWANVENPTTTLNLSGTSTKAVEPTVAGRTLDISAGGEAGVDWSNVGSASSTVNLSGTTISTSQAIASVSGAVGSVTGNVGGNVTGSVGSVVGNVGGNVTGTVGSVVGAVGSVTGNVGGNVVGSVGSVTAAVTVGTNNDKTGYALSAAGVTAVQSGLATPTTVLYTALTEGYRANGAQGTLAQILYETIAHLGESSITGTTKTINQIDHTTPAETFTLDSDTAPTSITRAT